MKGYGQFCPVAKGAEVFAERWTPLVLRELLCGSTHFSDLHRGVPLMSRSLLSLRLKQLEQIGVVERKHGPQGPQYHLTQAGREFAPIVRQLGEWGQRWFRSRYVRDELDVTLLMWDMRRCIEVARSRPAGPAWSSIFPICRRRSVPGGWSATARRSIFVPPTRDSRWVSTLRPTCGR
jgi:DNA-binding HxlR family transcriptional regulator